MLYANHVFPPAKIVLLGALGSDLKKILDQKLVSMSVIEGCTCGVENDWVS